MKTMPSYETYHRNPKDITLGNTMKPVLLPTISALYEERVFSKSNDNFTSIKCEGLFVDYYAPL